MRCTAPTNQDDLLGGQDEQITIVSTHYYDGFTAGLARVNGTLRDLLFLLSMYIKFRHVCLTQPPEASGFSLVELLVSVALIAVIAVALSVGVYRGQSRTNEFKAGLTYLQLKNNVLRGMVEDLRWATQIMQLDSQSIRFVAPDPLAGGVSVIIAYSWDSDNYILSRSCNGDIPIIVAQDMQVFSLVGDYFVRDATTYTKGLTVVIQIGPDSNSRMQQYIGLLNTPAL